MYLRFQNILTKNTTVPEIQKRFCRSNIRFSNILYSGGSRLTRFRFARFLFNATWKFIQLFEFTR